MAVIDATLYELWEGREGEKDQTGKREWTRRWLIYAKQGQDGLQLRPVGTIELIHPGSGYTTAPPVVFAGGGGTGATATAVIQGGVVTALILTSGGGNYTSAPTITIGPPAAGADFAVGTTALAAPVEDIVGPAEILTLPQLPKLNDPYKTGRFSEGDPSPLTPAICTSITAKQHPDSALIWEVTAKYSTEGKSPDETVELLSLEWGSETFDEFLRYWAIIPGVAPVPIVNSALQPFSPAPKAPRSIRTLTVVTAENNFDPFATINYENTVNSGVFAGLPAGLVKCKSIIGKSELVKGYKWRVTYTFHARGDGWRLQVLDQGFYDVAGPPINNPGGQAPPRAVLLDGLGHRLLPGRQPVFLSIPIFPPLDFNLLGIPFP